MSKAAQATVTLKHLAAEHEMVEEAIGRNTQLWRSAWSTKRLKKGDRIRIKPRLGILQVSQACRWDGRNVATGEPIKFKAARRSHSAHRRTSRKRSNFPHARHD